MYGQLRFHMVAQPSAHVHGHPVIRRYMADDHLANQELLSSYMLLPAVG